MHRVKERSLFAERTTIRTVLTAVAGAMLGLALLYAAAINNLWTDLQPLQGVLRDVGSLLVASVALSLLFELGGRRAFLDELLAKLRLSDEVRVAGLVGLSASFNADVDWDGLFQGAEKVDFFFAYARTWRNSHYERLQALAADREARVRVVLPDPEDELTVAELARRFKYTPDHLRSQIREAEEFFRGLRPDSSKKGATISLWYLRGAPHFSFYRFDRKVILALYSHRRGLQRVPTFVLEQGGSLYEFVRQEVEAMTDTSTGLARLIWEVTA